MKRMFRALMAGLTAAPLLLVAAVSAAVATAPPASAEDNGVGLTPALDDGLPVLTLRAAR
jgi:hypothetical protein